MTEVRPGHEDGTDAVTSIPSIRRETRTVGRRALYTLRIVIALAILVALARWSGPEEVAARLSSLSVPVAVSSVLMALLVQLVAARRLALVAGGHHLQLSTSGALGVNLSAIFYGLVLPGGNAVGWAVRLHRMSAGSAGIATAMRVLAGDRALTTAIGAAIGVAADSWLGGSATRGTSVLLVATAVAAGWLAWLLLVSGARTVPEWARRLQGVGATWLWGGHREHGPTGSGKRVMWQCTALTLLLHALGILIWWWLAKSIDLELDVLTIAWVRSAALVVGLVPLTVAGLGLREGAVVYLLTSLGISGADALSLSLLAFAVTVLSMGVIGGIAEAGRLLHRARKTNP